MTTYPLPPSDMMDMSSALQHQFTMMQLPPIALTAIFCLWGAYKYRSPIPIYFFLGGGITYMAEPLVNVLGLVWFPPNGINAIWESLGRPVPVFGFLAYVWFLGGMSFLVFHLLNRGITTRGMFILYGILVAVECALEIPGLNIGAFTYYGNQPFVVMKFPIWWAFINAVCPMLAGTLVYRLRPFVKPIFQPIFVYSVSFSNAAGMFACGLPLFFTLNTRAGLIATHIAGVAVIALACFTIWMITLLGAKDSPARTAGPKDAAG